jgi:tight adherence protein B
MSALFDDPFALLIGAGILFILICVFFAFGGGNKKQAKRVERLKDRNTLVPAAGSKLDLRKDAKDRKPLELLLRRFIPQPELIRDSLRRTGYSINLTGFAIACGVTSLVVIAALLFFGQPLIVAIPGGLALGLVIPFRAIKWLGARRATRFTNGFPEAIGLMVRGLKSGLPITETFQIVGNELHDPVGPEFRQVTDQIRLGQQVEQALLEAANRIDTPELKFLTVTLSIQRETGGNLAESLENLDQVLRRRRQMRLKIRAMSSEARASAMIIGALPFVLGGVLALLNPSYIGLLFTTTTGNHGLEFAGGMMTVGISVMAKMVRFEI